MSLPSWEHLMHLSNWDCTELTLSVYSIKTRSFSMNLMACLHFKAFTFPTRCDMFTQAWTSFPPPDVIVSLYSLSTQTIQADSSLSRAALSPSILFSLHLSRPPISLHGVQRMCQPQCSPPSLHQSIPPSSRSPFPIVPLPQSLHPPIHPFLTNSLPPSIHPSPSLFPPLTLPSFLLRSLYLSIFAQYLVSYLMCDLFYINKVWIDCIYLSLPPSLPPSFTPSLHLASYLVLYPSIYHSLQPSYNPSVHISFPPSIPPSPPSIIPSIYRPSNQLWAVLCELVVALGVFWGN